MKRTSRKAKRTSRLARNWPKAAGADSVAARELLLTTENEYSLYPQHQAIEKSLLRKIKSGRYDHSKAWKAWQYWMDAGAKLYVKQYGGSFSPATRATAAREYADQWYDSYKAGDVKANRRKWVSRNAGQRIRLGDKVRVGSRDLPIVYIDPKRQWVGLGLKPGGGFQAHRTFAEILGS